MTKVLHESKKSYLTPLLLLLVVTQGLSVVAMIAVWGVLLRLEAQRTVYLQTVTGEVVSGDAASLLMRNPKTIQHFAKEVVRGLFEMSIDPTLVAQGEGLDSIDIDGTYVEVPLTMVQASYGLADDLQFPLLQSLAEAIPSSVLSGDENYIVIFDSVSDPIQRGQGVWEVQVLGYQKVFRQPNHIVKSIPLKKRLVVEAVEFPLPPQSGVPLATSLFQIRKYGLQITEIHEL